MTSLPRLLFLHLDRTGGTSVINCLRTLYETRGQHFIRTDTPLFGQADCVAGHFSLNDVAHWTGYLIVTVLRHPADRELSVLGKAFTTSSRSLDQQIRVTTAQNDMNSYISTYVRDGLYASRYSLGPPSLDSARNTLSSFNLVGVTPKLDEFYERLCTLLGASRPPALKRDNRSLKTPFTWTSPQHATVTTLLKDDGIIYQHAWGLAKVTL